MIPKYLDYIQWSIGKRYYKKSHSLKSYNNQSKPSNNIIKSSK